MASFTPTAHRWKWRRVRFVPWPSQNEHLTRVPLIRT